MPRLMALLLPTALALYANFQGIQQILAPLQVEAIHPGAKLADVAMLTMICADRDLALLVMAGASAQFVAPVFGSLVIGGLGYEALFAVAAVVTLGAGAVTLFIRGVPRIAPLTRGPG